MCAIALSETRILRAPAVSKILGIAPALLCNIVPWSRTVKRSDLFVISLLIERKTATLPLRKRAHGGKACEVTEELFSSLNTHDRIVIRTAMEPGLEKD